MKRLIQFNEANWQVIFNHSTSVIVLGDKTYIPLSPVTTSILLEKDIAAVTVSTVPPDGKSWSFGGWVEQCFPSGLTIGGGVDVSGPSRRMLLDRITVFLFDPISADYSLKFYFPRWFRNVSLTCWQYIGPDEDSLTVSLAGSMSGITQSLDNLHLKIDQITT
ncbi:hypothetical protein PN456_15295 [Nodularia spumigena CS-586/05]|uniref:hypothetical protein n=1 Tax=Nodularia spumigena TaxID=70799 RepID=UPI00232DB2DA|nr:hypothetical protein [Nodularia spumigena]MDB9370302.1 hypothetical protein [Nodularia spumigena CS-586/05]